jgi:hypothetical protein
MNTALMLAEDIPPYVLVIVLVPALLALLVVFSMARAASRRTGRTLQTELMFRLVPVAVVILVALLVTRGNATLPVLIAVPVVAVLLSRYLRSRNLPEASPTQMKENPPGPPRAERMLSLLFMVVVWLLFLAFLLFCCTKSLRSPWTTETRILAGVSILCLVLIPVQIIRYFQNRPK